MIFLKEFIKKLILVILSIKVITVVKSLNLRKKKNLFIDLESNKGQGFNYFKKFFKLKLFDFILFEPNPNFYNKLTKLINETGFKNKIKLLNKAAYTSSTEKKLFGMVEDYRGELTDGASILREHNSISYKSNLEKAIIVKTFDFIDLLEKYKYYDNVIIKMDIEGSEYEVLEKFLNSKINKKNIKHIFVEFHTRFFSSQFRPEYLSREKKIKYNLKKENINYTNWI